MDHWEDINSEDDASIEVVLEETRQEVREWMDTYGRSMIREWMADNCKKLLAADGCIPRKAVKNTQAKSTKTSATSKSTKRNLAKTDEITIDDSE